MSSARRTLLLDVYPLGETLGVEEVITRCHHAFVHGVDVDRVHADDAVRTRREVAHLDVSLLLGRSFALVREAALRENLVGNLAVIIVNFWEYTIR